MTETVPAVTRAVAEYAVGADLSGVPEQVLDLARRSLVDTVGISVGARREESVAILHAALGAGPGTAASTVLTTGERAPASVAALLNGTAAHALDYDDVTDPILGHPSVALWPAVLAVAEQTGASGRDLLEAYVVGFEIITALAEGFEIREHYGRGWHATVTLGVLAATAAASRLLGSDVEQTRCALGLAGSMAGGSRQNFGTMTKPLHAGLCGRDAVLAATLAAGGFTADPDQLEAPLGFFAMFGEQTHLPAVVDALGRPWALQRHGLNVKKFPACYNTQRTADAMLALVADDGLRAEEVRRITLTVEPGGFEPLIHRRPTSGLQGKFSAEYVAAAALLDGRLELATFADEAVNRAEIRPLLQLLDRVEAAVPPVGPAQWDHSYAVLQVQTADRGVLTCRVDAPRGDRRAPLTREELEAKFRDAVRFSGSGWDADALLAQLWDVESAKPFAGFPALAAPQG